MMEMGCRCKGPEDGSDITVTFYLLGKLGPDPTWKSVGMNVD
jgi:hypothetical protein